MFSAELKQGFAVQKRVVHALMMREVHTRYGRFKLGYLWAIFGPLIHVATFVVLFKMLNRASPIGGGLEFFFVSGLIPFFAFQRHAVNVMSSYRANNALFSYPQVKKIDATIARFILDFSTYAFVFLVVTAFLTFLGFETYIENLVIFMLFIFVATLFGHGVGLINLYIIQFWSSYENIYAGISRLLYFTSGVFFVVDSMPKALREILLINPVLHIVELGRSTLYPHFNSSSASLDFVLWSVLVVLCIGMLLQKKLRW